MKLSASCLEAFKQHVLAEYPKEAVGVVVAGEYKPLVNTAVNPCQTFEVDALEIKRLGEPECLLHSHPYALNRRQTAPPQWPTTADMTSWLAGSIPWGIVATEGEGISPLVWLDENDVPPLVGREFVHGVHDCYSIVRDWFKLERGITLKNFARGWRWWKTDADLYNKNFVKAGFVEIDMAQAKVGDVVLMQYGANWINHAGVITGPNQILHHLAFGLSGHDDLGKYLQQIRKVVRYVGC
jgi:cell wall-associated NlpC family hydrolase